MNSVVPGPDDDQTPADGYRKLVDRVTRIETRMGDYGEGLVSDVRSIGAAQTSFHVLLCRVDEAVVKLSAQLASHAHTERERNKLDIQLHEAEREADATAANKRHEALAGKIDAARSTLGIVLAAQGTVVALLLVVIGMLWPGCGP